MPPRRRSRIDVERQDAAEAGPPQVSDREADELAIGLGRDGFEALEPEERLDLRAREGDARLEAAVVEAIHRLPVGLSDLPQDGRHARRVGRRRSLRERRPESRFGLASDAASRDPPRA